MKIRNTLPQVGKIIDGHVITSVVKTGKGESRVTSIPVTGPINYKFKVEIRPSKTKVKDHMIAPPVQYHGVLVGKNSETTFTGEPRKNKSALNKMIQSWFPGVTIVDKSLKK